MPLYSFDNRHAGPWQAALAGLTVLVVEDDPLVGEITAEALRGFGCSVLGVAATAGRALEMVATQRPDLALLDVKLSHGANTEPVAATLRSLNVPFVLVTAFNRDAMPPSMHNAPVVRKPWADQELGEALAAVIRCN